MKTVLLYIDTHWQCIAKLWLTVYCSWVLTSRHFNRNKLNMYTLFSNHIICLPHDRTSTTTNITSNRWIKHNAWKKETDKIACKKLRNICCILSYSWGIWIEVLRCFTHKLTLNLKCWGTKWLKTISNNIILYSSQQETLAVVQSHTV